MATQESIFILIEEEEIETIEDLIDENKVDVNEVDEVRRNLESTPFNTFFGFILAKKNILPLKNIYQDGYSPLILATSMGLHDIAEVLLDAKADIDYVAEACVQRVNVGISGRSSLIDL